MKILYLSHRFPFPPKAGSKVRAYHMIRHFTEQGHEVTVASLVRSKEEADQGKGIETVCREYFMGRVHEPVALARMFVRLPTATPSSMGYFYSRDLERSIERALKTTAFDLIFVHCSSVAQYVEDVRGIPKILDFCDMDSQKWISYGPMKPFPLSLGYYVEGFKMQLAEFELAKKFDMCTTNTRAELATLDGLQTGTDTDWFPNGVDLDVFKPTDAPYDPDLISFVGRMDYYPNEEAMVRFCDEVLPLIRVRRPTIKLSIVGAEPSKEVRALGRLPGVTVTGSVPEVQPYILRSACTVAPLNIARGTQNKILESMAMGIPVVASALAAAGVDAEPGKHLLAARSPEEYASGILKLLEDPNERRRLAVAGRGRMVSHHSWSSAMNRLDSIVERTLATRAS